MSALGDRADRLTELVQQAGLDLLVVTNLVNVRYLTGFTGSNGIALVGPGVRLFATDFRYFERFRAEIADYDVRRAPPDILEVPREVVEGRELRVGFDDAHVTVRARARLAEVVGEQAELVAAGGLVERLRAVKDPQEVKLMRGAAAIAASAYEWLVSDFGLAGRTEREVAIALERRAQDLGADEVSFPPIVAAAENGARPHAEPRQVEIARGTLVVIDFGCRLSGYCSDCTRTFATGPLDDEAAAVFALVLEAQEAALREVRAGAGARELDAVARKVISDAGRGEEFGHGLGHGVGLEVHEAPRLGPRAEGEVVAGHAVTIEPGVYVAGRFGVRIEDLVVVTGDGCDVLTPTPKELITV